MLYKQMRIIEYYGFEHQLKKLVEELRELESAILYDTKNTEHIQEEMADVLNLIEQITLYMPMWYPRVQNIKDYKIERQIERIEKEINGENM